MRSFNLASLAISVFFTLSSAAPAPGAPPGRESLSPVTFANPADVYVKSPVQPTSLAVREDGTYTTMYVCTDIEWAGTCVNLNAPYGICFDLIGSWSDSISSAGTSGGQCLLYRDTECTGGTLDILPGGYSNLVSQGFNDAASSFLCSSYNGV